MHPLRPPLDESDIINSWAHPSAEPLVAILCITYNHVAFIADAIDSFLAQDTTFPFRVIIHDDASDDGTSDVVLNYAKRYPVIIQAIIQKCNLRSRSLPRWPYIQPLLTCPYIAFCEGDDYWTDSLKLQTQIDFLQDNPDYIMSYHNAHVLNSRGGVHHASVFHEEHLPETYATEDLIRPWFLPTASRVVRTDVYLSIPKWTPSVESGDIGFLLLASLCGKLKYFNKPMSVYRLHDGGMSLTHVGNRKAFAMVHLYQCFNLHTRRAYQELLWRECINEINTHLELTSKLEIMSSLPPKVVLLHGLRLVINSNPFLLLLARRLLRLRRLISR